MGMRQHSPKMNAVPVPDLVESQSRIGQHKLDQARPWRKSGNWEVFPGGEQGVRRLVKSMDLGLDSLVLNPAFVTDQLRDPREIVCGNDLACTGHVASSCG